MCSEVEGWRETGEGDEGLKEGSAILSWFLISFHPLFFLFIPQRAGTFINVCHYTIEEIHLETNWMNLTQTDKLTQIQISV